MPNRPAVRDAYEEMMGAVGAEKMRASGRVKDEIIQVLREDLSRTKKELDQAKETIAEKTREKEKAEARGKYFRKQYRRQSQPDPQAKKTKRKRRRK